MYLSEYRSGFSLSDWILDMVPLHLLSTLWFCESVRGLCVLSVILIWFWWEPSWGSGIWSIIKSLRLVATDSYIQMKLDSFLLCTMFLFSGYASLCHHTHIQPPIFWLSILTQCLFQCLLWLWGIISFFPYAFHPPQVLQHSRAGPAHHVTNHRR